VEVEKLSKDEKQHTPEFETCIEQVMKQGHGKGSAFAICTAAFEKAGKPIYLGESETQKLHLFTESINLKGQKVSGVAIHPKRIFHPEEGMTHVYLREELEKAAPTLIGKPFGIDHRYLLPPPNVVTNAYYDSKEDGIAFEGTVDDQIAEQINSKGFKGVSIELNWLRPGGKVEYVNGVAPRNFELTSVHLLKDFPPGDKDAYIKFWNAIMEQLAETEAKLKQSVETPDIVALRKQLVETQAKLADAQKQVRSWEQKYQRFVEAIKDTHPALGITRAWSRGPQRMIQEQLRVLKEFES